MKSLADAQAWCQQQLADSESPAADSRALLCFVLQKNRTYLMTWPEQRLTEQQWQQLQQLVARRQQGHPVAHLTGEREFWSLPLAVNDSTLIPRPDTETLVEAALSLELPDDAFLIWVPAPVAGAGAETERPARQLLRRQTAGGGGAGATQCSA